MYFEHYANMFQEFTIKLSCSVVSTPIDIVIQRYLCKLRNKYSVKHVHIDKNITLNIEHFQLRLIAVLSRRCHFYAVVCFDESKPLLTRIMRTHPLFRFRSPHKVHAPTMVLKHYISFGTVKCPYRSTQNMNLQQTNTIFKILQDILNSVQTYKAKL